MVALLLSIRVRQFNRPYLETSDGLLRTLENPAVSYRGQFSFFRAFTITTAPSCRTPPFPLCSLTYSLMKFSMTDRHQLQLGSPLQHQHLETNTCGSCFEVTLLILSCNVQKSVACREPLNTPTPMRPHARTTYTRRARRHTRAKWRLKRR